MFTFKNFAITNVSTGYNAAATTIVLTGGGGAKMPSTVPFNAVWWDSTVYARPSLDPNVEIVQVTAISTDTLTITRAQESTSASTKNTSGSTYGFSADLTALTLNTRTGTGQLVLDTSPTIVAPTIADLTNSNHTHQNVAGGGTLDAAAIAAGTVAAARMPALTGDVTTSAGAVATTIAAGVVTLAKMANMATDSIIGRATASTGVPEVLTALPFANTGDVTRPADSTVNTIAAGAVSLAKMADVATDSILGRATAGTGSPEVLTALPFAATGDVTRPADSNVTTIAANAVTLAKMATMATDSILGRATAGTGIPEVLAALPWADTGDVTRAADGTATTIAANAVTLAKMATIAQGTIIGGAAGAGTATPTALTAVPFTVSIATGGTGATTAVGALDALITAETSVASATTTDLGAVASRNVSITGTTTITGFGTVTAGVMRFGVFTGALTLTHNATSLILPGAANITTAANDTFEAVSLGSGNWRVYSYTRASGKLVLPAGTVSAPAITMGGDLTTGPYRSGAGVWDVSGAGTRMLSVNAVATAVNATLYFDFAGNDVYLTRAAADALTIGTSSGSAAGALQAGVVTLVKTANFNFTTAASGSLYLTTGASGTVTGTLPTGLKGAQFYALVDAAQTLNITAGAGDTIRWGATVSATGGTISSNKVGAFLRIFCSKANTWVVEYADIGMWTLLYARVGNATLVGGTVTVTNTTVTANTVVMLTRKTSGGTIGTAITYTTSAGASFTITSDNILDTSTFSWVLFETP